MSIVFRGLFAFYRWIISPLLHGFGLGGCKFRPTCSEYAETAIHHHGVIKGTALAVWRLLRCHPFAKGGLDQVPPASRASASDLP